MFACGCLLGRWAMLGVGLCTGLVLALARPAPAEDAGPAVQAKLNKVEELRRIRTEPAEEPAFEFDAPGLAVTFALQVPQGKQVMSLTQPEQITATDSAGADLTQIANNVFDEKEYVELAPSFDDAPPQMELKLKLPARSATHFSVSTTVGVVVFEGLGEQVFEAAETDTPLALPGIPLTGVTARIKNGDMGAMLTLRPVGVQEHVEEIEIIDGEESHSNMGSMWDEQEVTYAFPLEHKAGMKFRVKVRKGVSTIPCRLELKNQALP